MVRSSLNKFLTGFSFLAALGLPCAAFALTSLEAADLALATYSSSREGAQGWEIKDIYDAQTVYGFIATRSNITHTENVVVLRGTQTQEDWHVNFDYELVHCPSCVSLKNLKQVQVSQGFFKRAVLLLPILQRAISNLSSLKEGAALKRGAHAAPKKSVMSFVGHSQGGALASLLAAQWKGPVDRLVTFGAPSVGNLAFVRSLRQKVRFQAHYMLFGDPITTIRGGVEALSELLGTRHYTHVEPTEHFEDTVVLRSKYLTSTFWESKPWESGDIAALLPHAMEEYWNALRDGF